MLFTGPSQPVVTRFVSMVSKGRVSKGRASKGGVRKYRASKQLNKNGVDLVPCNTHRFSGS